MKKLTLVLLAMALGSSLFAQRETGFGVTGDVAYTFGTGDLQAGRFEVGALPGYHFGRMLFAGIGTGVHYYFHEKITAVPVFAHAQVNFNGRSWIPFANMRLGYAFSSLAKQSVNGLYIAPSLGVKYRFSEFAAIQFSVGYSMQHFGLKNTDGLDMNGFTLRVGYEY